MPTYDYHCGSCGSNFEVICKISEMDEPKTCRCGSHDTVRFIGGAPAMGDSVSLGVRRVDSGFKEVLQKIHSKTPGSKLAENSRYI